MRRSPAKLSRVCRGSAAVAVRPASAFYTFDTATNGSGPTDATGNGRNGSSADAAYSTTAKVGAKAMTDGSFTVASTGVSGVATTWTVAGWLKTHTNDFDGTGSQVNGSDLIFRVKGNASGSNSQTIQFVNSGNGPESAALTDDTYYHAALVLNGGSCTAYLNGVVVATSSTSGTVGSLSAGNVSVDIPTAIDELGVWDVALTAREVARLASGRRPKNVA